MRWMGNTEELNAWLAGNGGASSTEVCGGEIEWSHDYTSLSDECGMTGSATVTFTAADDCGLTSTTTATFTIEDTSAPSIDVEASDMIVECDGMGNTEELNAWLAGNGGASSTEVCGGQVEWSHDYTSLSDECGMTGSATVTFTAADDCGLTSTTTATFTIEDTSAPSIDVEASDMIVECDGMGNTEELNAWLAGNGGASSTEVCGGEVEWSHDYTSLSDECGMTGSATVTFTATDDCGLTSTTTATFTIEDTSAPSIDVEASDIIVECDGMGNTEELNAWLAGNGGASASDVCGGNINWTHDIGGELNTDCGKTGSIVATFIATDACGLSSSTTATFTIEDTSPPVVIRAPDDITLSCEEESEGNGFSDWIENNAFATVEDRCGSIIWDVDIFSSEQLCGGTYLEVYNYTAADECGNSISFLASVTIIDDQPPIIHLPFEELNISCEDEIDFGEPWAEDECSEGVLLWSMEENYEYDPECSESMIITREYVVFDDCGNEAHASQKISITDSTPPTIEINPDGQFAGQSLNDFIVLSCNDMTTYDVYKHAVLLEDNCSDEVYHKMYNVTKEQGSCQEDGYVEWWVLYWSAEDMCGNVTLLEMNLLFVDVEAPVFGEIPGDVTVTCEELDNLELPFALDNCTEVAMSFTDEIGPGDCESGYRIVRTYQAVDLCGNESIYIQNILVIDGVSTLQFNELENKSITCGEEVEFDDPSITSSCGGLNIEIVDNQTSTNNGCSDSFTRVWIASDTCGNAIQISQTIAIEPDIEAPVIDNHSPILYMACGSDLPEGNLNVSDNCSEINVSFKDSLDFGECTEYHKFIRSWEAVDQCGNKANTQQVFYIAGDEQAPEFELVPSDVTINCNSDEEIQYPDAVDNCSMVHISFIDDIVAFDCDNDIRIIRNWIASDQCGNTSSIEQNIFYESDHTPPYFEDDLEDKTVECSTSWSFDIPGAKDVCSSVDLIYHDEVSFPNQPGVYQVINRTWIATDICGNQASITQQVEIVDIESPTAVYDAEIELTYEEYLDVSETLVQFDDNCSSVQLSGPIQLGSLSCNNHTVELIWVGVDGSGNETEIVQVVNVLIEDIDAVVYYYERKRCYRFEDINIQVTGGAEPYQINYQIVNTNPNLEGNSGEGDDELQNWILLNVVDDVGCHLEKYFPFNGPCDEAGPRLTITPNPALDNITLNLDVKKSDQIIVTILSRLGNVVYSEKSQIQEGGNSITMDISHIYSGTYYVLIKNTQGIHIASETIVIQDKM